MSGLIHLYCGEGKGKTTAAIGLALRAFGQGKTVLILQFLKGRDSGEVKVLKGLGIPVLRGKAGKKFSRDMTRAEREETRALNTEQLSLAVHMAREEGCDMLILDEAAAAYRLNLVDREMLRELVENKPTRLELVLTGRDPAPFMRDAADYITEMKKIRHPYDKGTAARRGVEF